MKTKQLVPVVPALLAIGFFALYNIVLEPIRASVGDAYPLVVATLFVLFVSAFLSKSKSGQDVIVPLTVSVFGVSAALAYVPFSIYGWGNGLFIGLWLAGLELVGASLGAVLVFKVSSRALWGRKR